MQWQSKFSNMRGKATKITLSNTYPIRSKVEMIRENLFFFTVQLLSRYILTQWNILVLLIHTMSKNKTDMKIWRIITVEPSSKPRHVFVKHGCPRWQESPKFWSCPTIGACDVNEVWTALTWTYSPNLATVWQLKL